MKKIYILILLALVGLPALAQNSEVRWYSIEEAETLAKKSPKPLFVDTYTDWCGWCKKMDKDTFTNPVIAEILNTKFYPVKFNAEGQNPVTFEGTTFVNDGKAGKAHQLAVALLNGQLSYPTVVILTRIDGQLRAAPVPGYREPKDMEILLRYFADNAFQTQKWEDFQKTFIGQVK